MCGIAEEIVEKEVADTKREAAINLLKSIYNGSTYGDFLIRSAI